MLQTHENLLDHSHVYHMLLYLYLGYRPNYKCAPPPNDTLSLVNDTDVWREFDKCSIKLHTNTSDGEVITETGCENGWAYDIPVEQSFVTEVRVLMSRNTFENTTCSLCVILLDVSVTDKASCPRRLNSIKLLSRNTFENTTCSLCATCILLGVSVTDKASCPRRFNSINLQIRTS